MDMNALLEAALAAREAAHAPYSQFKVGAAIRVQDGRIFAGCNVENLSFGLTMCAERVAVGRAITERAGSFTALVVVADTQTPISPCGACRQVLAEFNPELEIHLFTLQGISERFSLRDLLPRPRSGILER